MLMLGGLCNTSETFVGVGASVVKVAVAVELVIVPAYFSGWRWVCAGFWTLVHWGFRGHRSKL